MAKLIIYKNEDMRTFIGVENAPAEILCRRLIEELEKGPEVYVRLESDEDPLLAHCIWWENEEQFRNEVLKVRREYGFIDGLAVPESFGRLKEFVGMIFEGGNPDD